MIADRFLTPSFSQVSHHHQRAILRNKRENMKLSPDLRMKKRGKWIPFWNFWASWTHEFFNRILKKLEYEVKSRASFFLSFVFLCHILSLNAVSLKPEVNHTQNYAAKITAGKYWVLSQHLVMAPIKATFRASGLKYWGKQLMNLRAFGLSCWCLVDSLSTHNKSLRLQKILPSFLEDWIFSSMKTSYFFSHSAGKFSLSSPIFLVKWTHTVKSTLFLN